MDINTITHNIKHSTNAEENSCHKPIIESYVDDSYGTIVSDEQHIWNEVEKYIRKINEYYNNNGLINNISKTNIMIITRNNQLKKHKLILDEKKVGQLVAAKILGNTFNDTLTWAHHKDKC